MCSHGGDVEVLLHVVAPAVDLPLRQAVPQHHRHRHHDLLQQQYVWLRRQDFIQYLLHPRFGGSSVCAQAVDIHGGDADLSAQRARVTFNVATNTPGALVLCLVVILADHGPETLSLQQVRPSVPAGAGDAVQSNTPDLVLDVCQQSHDIL